jgi:hypothetical protein
MITLWKGKNPIYFGVKGQGHYKYNFWQQGRFRTITLVLYIGSNKLCQMIPVAGEELYLFWGL